MASMLHFSLDKGDGTEPKVKLDCLPILDVAILLLACQPGVKRCRSGFQAGRRLTVLVVSKLQDCYIMQPSLRHVLSFSRAFGKGTCVEPG